MEKVDSEARHNELDSKSDGSDNSGEITWTEEEEKRIRNKIDWRLVPTVTFLYLLCFLDRYEDIVDRSFPPG
jgi:hypothetical protein